MTDRTVLPSDTATPAVIAGVVVYDSLRRPPAA